MIDTPFVPVGRIVKVHGTGGEISVATTTDSPSALNEGLEVWIVPPPEGIRRGTVQWVRPGPKGPLVKIAGIEDRAAAEPLRGRTLIARTADVPEESDYGTKTYVGLSVIDEERGMLGRITDVIETGANDVWVIDAGPFGQVLIPVIDSVVLEIDEAHERARVRLLPGLIDEEPSR